MTSIPRARLSAEEQARLEDDLAAALEWVIDVVDAVDMAALFVQDTQQVRRVFFAESDTGVPHLPANLMTLSKGQRSKYRVLATWRVVVRWMRAEGRVDPDYRAAMEALYFSRFGNRTPYHWSGKNVPPGATRSAHDLAYDAAEGCWQTVEALRQERAARRRGASLLQETEAEFLKKATRRTLASILKLTDHWEVERGA